MEKTYILGLLALIFGLCRGDLTITPQNTVALDGAETTVLTCSASAPPPTARIMWTEFSTDGAGRVISDGRIVLGSHPNAARYAIVGEGLQYDLHISNLTLADGGQYLCQDINGAPPATFRGTAELVVLASDPVCEEFFTVTGSVIEGRYYTQECELTYKGGFVPNMTWTGPGNYDLTESATANQVWTMTAFTAVRESEGGRFQCVTRFILPPALPSDAATNVPDYEYVFTGRTLVVNWPPSNMQAEPIKTIYNVGDQITCSADSKPPATYRWTNMRTQVTNPAGAVFTVTEDMQGFDQVLRCNAIVLLDGSLYTSDLFINVTVPAGTTAPSSTTTVTTTPPLADGPCSDLTGHWSSTNPNAHLCIEMDSKGNLLTLIRNGTDPFFVAGNGKTQVGDYRHVGFTGIWPMGMGGVGGFTGECHSCYGNEVILLSGLSRNKARSPACGESAGTHLTNLYVLTRFGPPCREVNDTVYRPSAAHIKYMGIKPEQIIR